MSGLLFFLFFAACACAGQQLQLGVIAGTALTDDYDSVTAINSPGQGIYAYPSQHSLAAGAVAAWRFTPSFSVEANGIFRQLHFEQRYFLEGRLTNQVDPNPTVTWEFPIFAKFALPSTRWRPFIEAGPSFRTTGNLNSHPSHVGFATGVGFSIPTKLFDISPTLRYTRWVDDGLPATQIHTRSDQLQLLVAFTRGVTNDWRPTGGRFSLGVTGGLNLLGDFGNSTYVLNFAGGGGSTQFVHASRGRSFLIGPTFGIAFSDRISLQLAAIYQALSGTSTVTDAVFSVKSDFTTVTWKFPVLVRYQLSNRGAIRPFVEGGPSFRIPQTVTNFGASVGSGIETSLNRLRFTTSLRYTRWQQKDFGARANQLDLLVGVTF